MSFTMEVVSPVELKTVIEQEVKPEPQEVKQLKELAMSNVAAILELDLESLEKRKAILGAMDSFGMNTMRSSSDKNNLLQVSVANLAKCSEKKRRTTLVL